VQVEPIKHTLKAPGTKRLKLQYGELLSSLPLKFNLRRYIMVQTARTAHRGEFQVRSAGDYPIMS
jgi:hypothetical protein